MKAIRPIRWVRLTQKQSKRVAKFWDRQGEFTAAMLAQPVYRRGGYTLRIAIFNPLETAAIQETLGSINRKRRNGK